MRVERLLIHIELSAVHSLNFRSYCQLQYRPLCCDIHRIVRPTTTIDAVFFGTPFHHSPGPMSGIRMSK